MHKLRVIFSAPLIYELTPKSWREGIIMIPDLEQRSLFNYEINI
jgi:hypothetical protein